LDNRGLTTWIIEEIDKRYPTLARVQKWIKNVDNWMLGNLPEPLASDFLLYSSELGRKTTRDIFIENSKIITQRLTILKILAHIDSNKIYEKENNEDYWFHIRNKKIISESQINQYSKKINKMETKSEIEASIGASKELLEAIFLGIIKDSPKKLEGLNLQQIGKLAINQIMETSSSDKRIDSKESGDTEIIRSLVNLINGLSNLRNKVGSGHGRISSIPGLQRKHAIIAREAVHAITQFLI